MKKIRSQWITWDNAKLIEKGIIEIGDGYRAKNSEMGIRGLPFARAGNIDNGFQFKDADILDEVNVRKAGSKISRPGDVVFTSKGTVGRFAFVRPETPKFVYSPQLCYWRVKNPSVINPRFLFYWMHSRDFKNQVYQVKGLTDMADYVSLKDQRKMKIVAPPLPIQHKIASILSAYDDLIENNTKRIAILEEMAQAIYQEWFVRFRYPGHEEDKMVESELGMMPKGWNIEKLAQLVHTQYGYTESASEIEIGPKFLRGMDINKAYYIQWDSVPYCTIDEDNYVKYKLALGDIIIIRMADPGKVGIVEKEIGAIFASYLIRLQIRQTSISNYYLFYFLKSDKYQRYITGASTGTTRKSASAGVITDINLVIPPKDILESFENKVSLLRNMLNNLLDKNANLRYTRDLLLPKLISGEIDVEALDIKIPDIPELEEQQYIPTMTHPEPFEATQLALPL